MSVCQCCGQTIKPARKPRAGAPPAILGPAERARLTDAEFRAYCASVAPLQDCEFFLRWGVMADPIRLAVERLAAELRTRAAKPADRAALHALKDAARADAWTLHPAMVRQAAENAAILAGAADLRFSNPPPTAADWSFPTHSLAVAS